MPEIIPSIIAATYEEFEQLIRKVEPYVDRVHLDIMDGVFVSNTTIKGFEELMRIKTNLKFDVHLMISNPENQMYDWYQTSADRFIFHVEVPNRLQDVINQVQLNGKKAAIALNPETSIEQAQEYLESVDHVQFMTVHPGAYGQKFLPEVAYKIQSFRQNYEVPISVDGGINDETAKVAVQSGASILVVGTHIMQSADSAKTIEELKHII